MAIQYIKCQSLNDLPDGPVVIVKIERKREPICVLGNTTLTVPGITSRLNTDKPYFIEQARYHNLPNGLVVNRYFSTPNRRVSVILTNNTTKNIW